MNNKYIYEEKILSKGIIIILSLVTLAMASYLVMQLIMGPLGSEPAPTWLLALFVFVFILVTINFAFVTIKITKEKIKVNYGIFGLSRKWSDIKICEKDETHLFYGWGIRFGRYKKQWVWIYNVIGGPRVAFITDKKKPKGLIFSTSNPGEIIKISKEIIK